MAEWRRSVEPRVWWLRKDPVISAAHDGRDAEFIDMPIDERASKLVGAQQHRPDVDLAKVKATTSSRWNSWMVRTFIGS